MTDFNAVIDRRGTNSIKWKRYGANVLPLWVADMDFPAPEPVQAALRRAVEHGVYGYEHPTQELRKTVAARMERLYGWKVLPEMVVAIPGVIAGFNAAARTVCAAGQGILVQPPVYKPFLEVHQHAALVRQEAPLSMTAKGAILHYTVDMEGFRQAVHSRGAKTGMFLLCNPHNPTGQTASEQDLLEMAEACLKNDIVICSDEIHGELLLGGARHLPLASLAPEIAKRTITLIAPSKTFNVAGLYCAFAILSDPDLLVRFKKITEQMAMHLNSLGLLAAQASFSGMCDDWLEALRLYLTGNRDFLVEFVKSEIPDVRLTIPEATYLAWLDCNAWVHSGRIPGTPHEFFLKQAGVAVNDGAEFGSGGEGFVRLNFGCPRATLEEALERMKAALGKI